MIPLPRWLSKCGALSRKAAEQAVYDGRVTVDGRVVRDVLFPVNPARHAVALDGAAITEKPAFVWVALNKPRGVVTTTADPEGRPTVMDLVAAHRRPGLAPVGRLDLDSAGLLLLTDDHALAARLLDPATHVQKTYRVKVRGAPSEAALHALRTTTRTLDGLALGPMGVAVARAAERSTWLRVTLDEGKNRQVRRRLEAEGHPVEILVRTDFGPIALGELAPGAARVLSAAEVAALARAAKDRHPREGDG